MYLYIIIIKYYNLEPSLPPKIKVDTRKKTAEI